MVYHSLKNALFGSVLGHSCSLCQCSVANGDEAHKEITKGECEEAQEHKTLYSNLCSSCINSLKRNPYQCSVCARNLSYNSSICGNCLKSPPKFQACIAATDYSSPVSQAISHLKFNKQLHLIRSLSELLANTITNKRKSHELPQVIIPIPLHPKRLRERGFNQSLLIAKQLSKRLSIPLASEHLYRVKNTPHQIGLKAVERRKNLRKAFELTHDLSTVRKKNQSKPIAHVALIDDVMTTSSTMNEACKPLLKAGVTHIEAWCLAKT